MLANTQGRGRLILGAKPLAVKIFNDEARWRSLYTPSMQRVLGIFRLGNRLAGYEEVIAARLDALVEGSVGEEPNAPQGRREHRA